MNPLIHPTISPLRRDIHPRIEPIGGSTPVIDFLSSDETLDRYNEIIIASGWRLENYRKNPVVQNAHQYGDILFTIGKALVTEVRGDRLYQRIEFATEVNPIARIAYGLYKGGFLNAVSVGFIPIRWENGNEHSGFERKFLEQELIEISAVGIPANPNALQVALAQGAIEKKDLRDMADILERATTSGGQRSTAAHSQSEDMGGGGTPPSRVRIPIEFRNPADHETTESAPGLDVHAARWLQLQTLLKQIREVIRKT